MTVSTDQAAAVLAAASAHAKSLGIAVNIAVLDDAAHLKAFLRMDRALLGSIDVAIGKARAAALFQTSSEAVGEWCKAARNLEASNGGLMPFAGGLPLLAADGTLLGAVGVSGGAVTQDLEIAQAASAALRG